mmetsp:Transcript_4108/g.6219  ORF Transcript_4108/g.6219 Transcript_4108/m.6219 type:complete len:137 (+) Transcript_4108:5-415(+)
MLRRYKKGLSGDYTQEEKADAWKATHLIVKKAYARDENMSELEKDYMKFCKKALWSATWLPFATGCVSFLLIDRVYPVNKLGFLFRWSLKIGSFFYFCKKGLEEAEQRILEFPLLTDVTAYAIVQYTDWVELQVSE